MRVQSPELARLVLRGFKVAEMAGAYRVERKPDGSGVRCTATAGDAINELAVDPDTRLWQRLRVMLISVFVPESPL